MCAYLDSLQSNALLVLVKRTRSKKGVATLPQESLTLKWQLTLRLLKQLLLPVELEEVVWAVELPSIFGQGRLGVHTAL